MKIQTAIVAIMATTLFGCSQSHSPAHANAAPETPDVDLLGLEAATGPNVFPTVGNWMRTFDPATGVWTELTDNTGPPYHEKKELIAACEEFLKRTNRADFKLAGYTSHARLWIFTYGPSDPGTLGSVTLFVDSKTARVMAQTIYP